MADSESIHGEPNPPLWQPAETHPSLPERELHLWRARLATAPAELSRWQAHLSPDERERAACFKQPGDASNFTAARGLLRQLLSRYLACPAAAIVFHYLDRGKPVLNPAIGSLEFNLSHSGGFALYAFSQADPVGVDLELINPALNAADMAAGVLSENELAGYRALPQTERLPFFYRIWTAKEALLKAAGEGLSVEPNTLDLRFEGDRFTVAAPAEMKFSGSLIPFGQGCAAAFAIPSDRFDPTLRIRFFSCSEGEWRACDGP